jgi:hypothetical protein
LILILIDCWLEEKEESKRKRKGIITKLEQMGGKEEKNWVSLSSVKGTKTKDSHQ